MQPLCEEKMNIARELLDFGVLGEGVERLAKLQDCACRAGCNSCQQCAQKIKGQWLSSKPSRPLRSA